VIGVLASGEGTNLQALIDAGLPIVAVASNKAEAKALERARAAGIPAEVFADELEMAAWLEERDVRVVVLAGYMRLLSPAFLERFDPIVNVHPSLLPSFPGLRAIEQALEAGVSETGVTVHLVDEGIDSGPVLRQEPVPVEPQETLVERIHAVEHRLLSEVVGELCRAP
jgi:phosphoribosylglycinamide formyltransferase-1